MTRRRKPGQQRKTGPKTIFTNKQLEDVELLANLAATNKQIALYFNVGENTIDNWLVKHEDFAAARRRGGIEADVKVARALFQRAIGYEFEETEAIRTLNGDFITKIHKKRMAPNVTAQMNWLKTRQREIWAVSPEFQMYHRHSGKIEHMHNALEDIPVNELSKSEQKFLFGITQKQLSNGDRDN